MKTIEQVLNEVKQRSPALFEHIEMDRNWVWYCGPSLAPRNGEDPNAELRKILKEVGFRYAKGGHAMPSGAVGSWGHHCDHPTPRWMKNKKQPTNNKEEEADPVADLASMFA